MREDHSVSDGESDVYQPEPTKKVQRCKTVKRAKGKARKRKGSENDDTDEEVTGVINANRRPHAVTLHEVVQAKSIRVALLQWYDKIHELRGMPWRKVYNPEFGPAERAQRAYEVWISEIMLQQTQVATVIPYYNKWMAKFPTIRDLAASDIETVNSLWKGLGYYSRAARLLSGAQKVVKEFKGRLPDNAKDMEAEIPGIGRYSAGAICSIAYNQCVPVLDGNVHRLLSRVLALYTPPKDKKTLDILWAGAGTMVEGADRPGDINQAMIELGSTVCKVRDPACDACPIRPRCRGYVLSRGVDAEQVWCTSDIMSGTDAHAESLDIEELCTLCKPLPLPEGSPELVTVFPMKAERKKAREELDIVNVIEWRSSTGKNDRWFLLVRRPDAGLLAGLHEFPTEADVPTDISSSETAKIPESLLSELLKTPLRPSKRSKADGDVGLQIVQVRPAGDVLHVFSHIRKTYRVNWVVLEGGSKPPELMPFCPASTGKAVIKGQRGRAKAKRAKNDDTNDDNGEIEVLEKTEARWLPLEEVAKANIGTGVVKVWNKAKALWGE
ncbi:DNA glycosylase [Neolentinus lepideus HHB14362 ss-1]|uniref:Adenine DNA glycosylase n=1 Tax=Neolentinus lepideus HHB14362 ss-1 TaxID=1314782 RepID=A0A165UFZ9_9AGAM|nr:DNA glycosylase [Neolentinus lepideus HHB14362 ss-1]